jgi:hypothetical protein
MEKSDIRAYRVLIKKNEHQIYNMCVIYTFVSGNSKYFADFLKFASNQPEQHKGGAFMKEVPSQNIQEPEQWITRQMKEKYGNDYSIVVTDIATDFK